MMETTTPAFVDGLGRRVVRKTAQDGTPTEHLLLDPVMAGHSGFVSALRDRVAKIQTLRLPSYARVLRVEDEPSGGVALVSEHVPGWRLADILDVAESEHLTFDIGVVMLLLRQLLPTAALLTRQSRDVASGALGPEHLVLTAGGRVFPTEYVIGPAVDALGWKSDRLWRELRIATPVTGADAGITHRGDVTQLGVTMLSLVVGRRLRDDEFPERLEGLINAARQRTPNVVDAPLSKGVRSWLMRALQLESKNFATLFDAQMALEKLLASESSLIANPAELDVAVARLAQFMPFEPEPQTPPEPVALPHVAAAADDWAPKPQPGYDFTPPSPVVPAPSLPEAFRPVEDQEPPAARTPAAAVPVPHVVEAPTPVVSAPAAAQAAPARHPKPTPAPDRDFDDEPASPRATATPAPTPWADLPQIPAVAATPWWRSTGAVAALAALTVIQAAVLGLQWSRPSENLGSDGELVVSSKPEGAQVLVDDKPQGQTPLTIRIAPGTHVMQVRVGNAEPRVIPLSIRAGVQTAQYVELQGVTATGAIEVRSEPQQVQVTIDGQAKGGTPVTLRDVAPGSYQVVLERAGWKSTQVVRVEPGITAHLLVPTR